MKILSSFTRPQVVPNLLYEFLSSTVQFQQHLFRLFLIYIYTNTQDVFTSIIYFNKTSRLANSSSDQS